jgi:predicted O-linked N-acetylglucosamine transferase (SPINDLY family)
MTAGSMKLLFDQAIQAHQIGKVSEAENLYRQIITADPKHFDALHMLGIVCSGNGKYQDADKFFRAALLIDSKFPPCHVNYGFYLLKQKRLDEAVESFDKALALFPNFAEAWFGRGNALRALNRHGDAISAYNQATVLKPNLAEAHAGIGNILASLKRYDEAITAYDRALALKSGLEFAEGERMHCKMRLCDWNNFSAEYQRLVAGGKGKNIYFQPFDFLSVSSSTQEQIECAKFWVSQKCPASDTPIWQGEIYNHDKIRIAYVSADFRQHPMSFLIAGFIEAQDRSRFDLTAISLQPEDPSEIGQRIKRAFGAFLDVSKMSDDKVANLIHELEIDIAIDLNGYTQNSRPNIFACRAAPVQASYMGFPGTMGAEYIDYIIADRIVVPLENVSSFSEKIVWLPDTYWVADQRLATGPRIPSRADVGLPENAFVFCCFNQTYKILPDIFDSWMHILQRADTSVLWLLEDNTTATTNLRKEAAARGVDPDRLIFASRVPLFDHLARHKCADLFLDTLPYNAHTTASDALWAGLPVLTQIGETFAGRVAASLLNSIGLPELITSTRRDYIELAIELTTAPEKLAVIKHKLLQNRLTKPLFNTRLFTSHIEASYTAMYERYQAGLPPDHINVPQ